MITLRRFIFLLYFFTVNCSGISSDNEGSVTKGVEILFLGLSGSGKSSTINMLLGNRVVNELKKKMDELKPTKKVIEYTLSGEGGESSEDPYFIRFIDTPGLGSTTGVLLEARVVSTLEKYLMEKGSFLPSVILIFSKFDDNRVAGEKSNFVKMLKKYNDLVDQVYSKPNVIRPQIIFVFTHYLEVTKREQRNPKSRLSTFTNIIQNYTTFPTPIVTSLAENEAEDEELDLDEDTGSYMLPNREWYPQNLIDKILDGIGNRSSTAELNAYKRIFEKRKELNFTEKYQGIVSADNILPSVFERDLKDKFTSLDLQQSQKNATENVLIESEESDNSINENTTTVGSVDEDIVTTTETVDIFQNLNLCTEESDVIPSELELLKNILSEQSMTELPKNREELTQFIQKLSLNETQMGILEKCFGAAIPTLYLEDSIVGYGYDILRNLPMSDTPFKTDELIYSTLGFKIPAWINSSVIKPEEELSMQNYFNKSEDFLNMRLNNLSLENSLLGISEKDYTPQFTVGNNIRETWVDEEIVKITSLREYRQFSWSLRELESFDFNDDFLETLSELTTFDTFNKDSVNEWNSFFSTYGTHLVTFAYGGGSLESHVHVKRSDIDALNLNEYMSIPEPSNNFSNIRMPHLDKLKFNGGLDKYRKYLNFKDNTTVNSTYTIFVNWHQSLTINPIILETNLLLMPWSEVIRSKNLQLSEEMEKATKAYLTGTLKYKKMRVTESTIAPIPETTTKIFTTPESTSVKTTENSVTLSPEEATSSTTKTETESEEMTDELFQSHIKGIREIVSTLTKTCNLTQTIPILPQAVSNTSVRYGESRRSVYNNLKGLINAVNTSGVFCKNKYLYEDSLGQLKRDIGANRLSIEKLSNIYREMRFLFPQPPKTFNCNRLEIGSSSEYLGSHIGYGYNIQYNLPIKRTPFESVNQNIQCVKVFADTDVIYTYKILREDIHYYDYHRIELRNLSPTEPRCNSVKFFGPLPSGINSYHSSSNYTWLEEYVTFSAHFSPKEPLQFSSEFKIKVSRLPILHDNWIKGNCITKLVAMDWKSFFNDYGTHIVISSNAGGALEIFPNSRTRNYYFRGLDKKSEYEKSRIFESINKEGLPYFSLGGNTSELHKNGLSQESIYAWRRSLREKSTLLQSGLQLNPIIELIKRLRPELTATADALMKSLYAGEIRTYCNCRYCYTNSYKECYSELSNSYYPRSTSLGMCYAPDGYQCSIRHLGYWLNCN